MSGVATAVVGGSIIGGMMSSNAAKKAAQISGDAQIQAAQIAAEASKFRPVGMTTNFGQSNFVLDENGNLTSAGYTLDPRLQNLQTGLMGSYGGYLNQAQNLDTSQLTTGGRGLMSLGQQYLATSPQQAAQDYITAQKSLLAPIQEQELAGVRNRLFRTGRTGLATGGTAAGNMAQTNPEMAAYYNALARTDAQLAADAEKYGLARTQTAQGLLTGGADVLGTGYGLQTKAYGPLQTTLGLSQSVEGLGQDPFTLGANLGGRTTQANQYGAGLMNTAASNAAIGIANANAYSPIGSAITGAANSPYLSSWFNRTISQPYGGTAQGGYATQNAYLNNMTGSTQQEQMLMAQNQGLY